MQDQHITRSVPIEDSTST